MGWSTNLNWWNIPEPSTAFDIFVLWVVELRFMMFYYHVDFADVFNYSLPVTLEKNHLVRVWYLTIIRFDCSSSRSVQLF